MIVTLHWWIWPLSLVVATVILWWHGSREPGMFGGMVQFLVGVGLLIGAAAATITRLWP